MCRYPSGKLKESALRRPWCIVDYLGQLNYGRAKEESLDKLILVAPAGLQPVLRFHSSDILYAFAKVTLLSSEI